ncbi:hypothetical protein LOZ12_005802 [Ophidiomyces ophidiicola]|uniref:Uncharacterized protein n=1 Tax=Ophidiomyces ophidiicola TaxID=1387563 RepID=A0ACB8V398_9EURO|nr:uncharacterized protein LOZ57_000851 [Ophidiomyces ophidiicola]KAI1952771.1 hypothetical protein LOZ57_000851 [Ophidiomyces ophidiicola]KAI1954338.1 hypothetical protein LOZ62_000917 [Ophidiomyces ophidiicola]KAI1964573.1 hypothetical protein LOZ56_006137 [Ophidiomyces ophidiicola]KAI1969035.1 hypothetical protein LOZ59_000061 [Ophidiomyces ophidiicola]KAI2011991.1 hypothetical protein LOZ50_000312 [Ophidiomyces ophidiicola]
MAARVVDTVRANWNMFSATERRNVAVYILGIMLYKFGLEAFNGSIVALATNRYDYDAFRAHAQPKTFERVGLLTGLNQAFQCIGSILIAPLVRRAPTRLVLAVSILVFGLFTALLLILDASTGGRFVPPEFRTDHPSMDFHYYGHYNTDGIIPIYCVTGVVYGMVELIRRVIPRDIVGGNVQKLRRMDALVHVFYEISGTAGAFCTALALIPQLGNNYSFIITPVCFFFAGCTWLCIHDTNPTQPPRQKVLSDQPTYVKAVFGSFFLFGESLWTGARLILTNRRFIWLVPGYAIAFYGHRYLENGLAPAIARRYLGHSAWSQVIVGGSNLGELFGAAFVFLFTNLITTPIPWIRTDAIMLLVVWYLPFWHPPSGDVRYAWIIGATFLPISFGWAAGDVSLAAYIQATLARVESKTKNVSALGAVMACLYTTYIVIYAITSPILGQYIDNIYIKTGGSQGGDIHEAILNVAGIQYTIMAVIIFASTFVPQGSFALNPKLLFNQNLDADLEVCEIGSVDTKKSVELRNTDRDASSW